MIDQGHIDFVLKDAAKALKCRVKDLEYKVDKLGLVYVRKKGTQNGKENGNAQQGHGKENVETDGHKANAETVKA